MNQGGFGRIYAKTILKVPASRLLSQVVNDKRR